MPLVQAKCENCNGVLKVDSSKRAAICPYCGTPYVVEDAINYYTTHNHIHADIVNVRDDRTSSARLEAAEAFMTLNKYSDALSAYKEVSQLVPQDYRGWWGQIRAITKDFSFYHNTANVINEIKSLYNNTLTFVTVEKEADIRRTFTSYINSNREYCLSVKIERQSAREGLQAKMHEFEAKTKPLEMSQKSIEDKIQEWNAQDYSAIHVSYDFSTYSSIVGGLMFFIGLIRLIFKRDGVTAFLLLVPIVCWMIGSAFISTYNYSQRDGSAKRDRALSELQQSRAKIIADRQSYESNLKSIKASLDANEASLKDIEASLNALSS